MVANPPASLAEVFEQVVNAIGTLRGGDHRLADAGNPAPEFVTDAAQRLLAASLVCQLVNIEMPQASLHVPEKTLSARLGREPALAAREGVLAKTLLLAMHLLQADLHQARQRELPSPLLVHRAENRSLWRSEHCFDRLRLGS